jgi:hypothetical protein
MKLDTLLEAHSEAVRGAVQDAPIPDLFHTARRSRAGSRWGFALVVALATAGLVVAIVLGGPNVSTPPSTGAPASQVTSTKAGQSWLPTGEPLSDQQFFALVGDNFADGFVPGTAIRLAWSDAYLGRFDVGVFAVQWDLEELSSGAMPGLWYCMDAYAAPIGETGRTGRVAGARQCAESVDAFEAMISEFGFAGGGSCAGWLGNVAYVWDVPVGVGSVEFDLRDGSVLTADVDGNGYALVAWDFDIPLVAVSYEGISAENAAVLDSFKLEDAQSCAEMSARKPG